MATTQEQYKPVPVGANATVTIHGKAVGGFLCTATGTMTLIANAADGKPQTTLLNGVTCTADTWYPLPFYLGSNGGTFTTASSGAGLLGVV